jgi:hypothetical protein
MDGLAGVCLLPSCSSQRPPGRRRLAARGICVARQSARLVHAYIERQERIYFLVRYAKNERDDLTPDDAAVIRRLIHTLEEGA